MKSENTNQYQSSLMNSLSNSPIFNLHDCGLESKYKIHYLKYTLVESKEADEPGHYTGFTSGYSTENGATELLALKVCSFEGEVPEDGKIYELSQNDYLLNEINSDAVDVIRENSIINSSKLEINISELNIDKNLDEGTIYRRILSRILSGSNQIAMNHRRGPGSYVIMHEDIFEYIKNHNKPTLKALYNSIDNNIAVAGLLFYCSDRLQPGEFIVGRKGREDEPGLHLTTSEAILFNYYTEDIDDARLKLRYKIDVLEELPAYYFKLNFTDESKEA